MTDARTRSVSRVARARLLVIVKTTSHQKYVTERADTRTAELLEKKDPAVRRLVAAHEAHTSTVRELHEAIEELGVVAQLINAGTMRECAPDEFDLVVTVGGDGTLLTSSHGVGVTTPILGINSAPEHSVGFFCGARKGRVKAGLEAALDGSMRRTVVSRMQVELNGRCASRRVLNDALFCHEIPAATSRYILTLRDGDGKELEEEQKSSGLWIGPAAGSTAAQRSAGGQVLPLNSRRIQYVVREPYTPLGDPLALWCGTIGDAGSIVVRSKMRQGRLFLDGPHVVYDVGLGDLVSLRRSDENLTVLGLTRAASAEKKPTARASRKTARRPTR